MAKKILPLKPGDVFGRLTIIAAAPKRADGTIMWRCQCTCGTERLVMQENLRKGRSQSCGCAKRERGMRWSRSPEYDIWVGMIQRCHNPNAGGYEWYGARGITVSDECRASFGVFFADVGPRPSPAHSIERIDNSRGYEIGNMRWATPAEQNRNMRRNIWITHNGETKVLKDWAVQFGINPKTLSNRLRLGWPLERALTEPRYFGPHR